MSISTFLSAGGHRPDRFLVILVALLAPAIVASAAEDWPCFRGPRGDGTAAVTRAPLTWSATNGIAWQVELPGRGRSSPVVAGSRVWLTTAWETGIQRTRIGPDDMQTAEHITLGALCVDATNGALLWQVKLIEVEKPDPVHWLNSWATPTPVIEGEALYCDFGTYGTVRLEAGTGKVVWQTRLAADHQVGPGSSPVLWHDLLILARDGRDAQYVAALDKATGRTIWKTDRPPVDVSSGNLKKSFVTPLIAEVAGRTQLIAPAAHWVLSYDPATGKERWRARHGDGFSIGTCPVVGQGLAFFGTGCFKAQLCAIRLEGDGDVTATNFVWKTLRQVPVMSSPVLAGDLIYWVSDDGMATCAEALTGTLCWQERLGGAHLASPVVAAGRVYFFSQDGDTTVVKAGREFVKLVQNRLAGPVVATPAVVDGAIFLRNDTHLYRITGAVTD